MNSYLKSYQKKLPDLRIIYPLNYIERVPLYKYILYSCTCFVLIKKYVNILKIAFLILLQDSVPSKSGCKDRGYF